MRFEIGEHLLGLDMGLSASIAVLEVVFYTLPHSRAGHFILELENIVHRLAQVEAGRRQPNRMYMRPQQVLVGKVDAGGLPPGQQS